ncbi:MAG TPA: alpha/beta hydrolase [Planctomycetota bacterium]|jgi:pimeloyl-ACP methyl ester carboxylesterase|nr:alpha/beta hydrolase [Planctomycetota bacterium]
MWKSAVLAVLASVGLAVVAAPRAPVDEPVGKPPDSMATPLTAFAWKSVNGLRYVWWLPKGYDPAAPRNMTVICHGVRLDYRWGYWNFKPGLFRPDDVVISVDGPSPDGEDRLFSKDKKDFDAFAAFLTEMKRTFSVDRILLYGHGQGGLFALSFAGDHSDLVAGVVAHGTGEKNGFETGVDPRKVAIALLHGTADADASYAQILDRRDAYAKLGCSLLLLRRLDRCGHEPNPVRAAEALAWCQGMTASKPEEALACALELLRVKPADVQDRETKVAFSAARDVLRRIEKKGPAPFTDVPEDVATKAGEWIKKVEDAGTEHLAAIRTGWKSKRVPKLDGGAWLGHLVPLREDFRGVDSVEAFVKESGYDAMAFAHAKAAEPILAIWVGNKDPKKLFEKVVDDIGKMYLYDGFPFDFAEKMKEWFKNQRKLVLSVTAVKKYADFEAWEKGWHDGLAEYVALCKSWKGP